MAGFELGSWIPFDLEADALSVEPPRHQHRSAPCLLLPPTLTAETSMAGLPLHQWHETHAVLDNWFFPPSQPVSHIRALQDVIKKTHDQEVKIKFTVYTTLD